VLDDGKQPIVLTALSDISEMLSLALSDSSPWPVVGGMCGCKTDLDEILAIGKKLKGGEWTIDHIKDDDIEKGELKSSWVPLFDHPTISVESREKFSKDFAVAAFQAILNGSWGRE
jgi:hypothetical protein